MIYEMNNRESAVLVFDDWKATIIWSCLQGVMGHIYAEHKEEPASVMEILGDFCFYAGKPNKELIAYKPKWYRDLVSQFADYPSYEKTGLGVVVLKDGIQAGMHRICGRYLWQKSWDIILIIHMMRMK